MHLILHNREEERGERVEKRERKRRKARPRTTAHQPIMRRGAASRNLPPRHTRLALKPDIDPPPKPWPFAPALALLVVVAFLSLQFFKPATHVRDPNDPYRNWIPKDHFRRNSKASSAVSYNVRVDNSSDLHSLSVDIEKTLIFVSAEETDLRPLAVVINSTACNTRKPENLHFYVLVPSRLPDSAILKLKGVFPDFKLDLVRDHIFRKKMKQFTFQDADEERPRVMELLPFYLPEMFPDFEKILYLDSDAILQGDIEELLKLDMQGHAVAAVEDCSQTFETFVSSDLIQVTQTSQENGKPLMPAQFYEPKTCFFDKGALMLDQKAWKQKNITGAIQWWIKMFHKSGKRLDRMGPELPMQLALYQNYKKIDASWSIRADLAFERADVAKIIHFDKKQKPWHDTNAIRSHQVVTRIWWKYLSPAANEILPHSE